MRLAVLIDVIAIAAGIAIILPPVDGRAENAAEDRAGDRARRRRSRPEGPRRRSRRQPRRSPRRSRRCRPGCCHNHCRNSRCCNRWLIAVVVTVRVVAVLVRVCGAAGRRNAGGERLLQVPSFLIVSSLPQLAPCCAAISAIKRRFVPASIMTGSVERNDGAVSVWSFRDTALETARKESRMRERLPEQEANIALADRRRQRVARPSRRSAAGARRARHDQHPPRLRQLGEGQPQGLGRADRRCTRSSRCSSSTSSRARARPTCG